MRNPAAQCVFEFVEYGARRERQEICLKMAGEESIEQISKPVERQYPHSREMPLQSPAEPSAKRQVHREFEREYRGRVVDAPAAENHDEHRDHVYPVSDAHRQWMHQYFSGPRRQLVLLRRHAPSIVVGCSRCPSALRSVSYTHLTLPTSDLV